MSQADFKHTLRQLSFPSCAVEALPRIEHIIINRTKQNFAMQLISEFVFMERTKEGKMALQVLGAPQMSAFQEFQLILALIEFFAQPRQDSARNTLLLSLFGGTITTHRTKILCKLVSTAVSGSVASLLTSAGAWMQQVGCTTAPSLDVAQSLVNDFILFAKRSSEQLKQLPMVAPRFASNFMTAVADLYMKDQSGSLNSPPEMLLDVFSEWLSENPSLCLASQQPLALPSGAIAMPVVTPLAGLIRWTVLAPLVSQKSTYSDLHLSLLQALIQIKSTGPPTALNAQHLSQIVGPLKVYTKKKSTEGIEPSDDPCYQKSMERFAQAVQVALASKCVYGNIPQLLCSLETLPQHHLMQIVINVNKSV